jgi:hypothetical protein
MSYSLRLLESIIMDLSRSPPFSVRTWKSDEHFDRDESTRAN